MQTIYLFSALNSLNPAVSPQMVYICSRFHLDLSLNLNPNIPLAVDFQSSCVRACVKAPAHCHLIHLFLQVLACKHLPTELLATPGERAGMLTQVRFKKILFLSKSIEIIFQAAAMLEGLGDKKRLAEVKKI